MGRRTRMFLLKQNSNLGWGLFESSKPTACVCTAASPNGKHERHRDE